MLRKIKNGKASSWYFQHYEEIEEEKKMHLDHKCCKL